MRFNTGKGTESRICDRVDDCGFGLSASSEGWSPNCIELRRGCEKDLDSGVVGSRSMMGRVGVKVCSSKSDGKLVPMY